MKKLLTLLLTLVMAVCLVNLNYNHTKAESNADYPIYLGKNNSGVYGVYADSTCSTTYTGSYATNITVSDTVNGVYVIENLDMTNPNGNCITVTANATIKYKGTNTITSKASGVYGDPTIQNSNGANITIQKYDDNNNSLTIDNQVYSNAGILMSGGTITFVDGNVKMKRGGLETVGGNSISLTNNAKLIVNDANIELESTQYGIFVLDSLSDVSISSSGSILVKCGESAITINENKPDFLSGYVIKASKDKTGSNPTDGIFKYNSPHTKLYDGDDVAQYAYITKNTPVPPQPTPSPSEPVVKDESCEKVIGPTWHWNNEKGVCEEYATVGTATR